MVETKITLSTSAKKKEFSFCFKISLNSLNRLLLLLR